MLFFFKILAVLAVVLLVGKRAIKGPQKSFARLAVVLVMIGFISLGGAVAQGDFAATAGAILLLAGMLVAVIMLCVDCFWTVKTGLKRN